MSGRLFVKLDVDYPDNPKIISAGPMAELLYVRGLCLAKRTLSDGFIDSRQFARMGIPDADAHAETLVANGLWRSVKNGYRIVGWLERNNSAKRVAEIAKERAAAGSAGGKAKAANRGGEQSGDY